MSKPKPPEPNSAWLDEFKQMDVDDMLTDLCLFGDDDFVRAMDEKLYGPIPAEENG